MFRKSKVGGHMSENFGKPLLLSMIVLLLVFLISTETFAAGEGGHGHGKSENIGRPGEKSEATKIVKIAMFDNYFQPKSLQLNEGETVQFIVKNLGEFVHEFNIATKDMHKSHGPEMLMMVEQIKDLRKYIIRVVVFPLYLVIF